MSEGIPRVTLVDVDGVPVRRRARWGPRPDIADAALVARYRAGRTVREIAAELAIGRETVRRRLGRAGEPMRPPGPRPGVPAPRRRRARP